jgi:hypothetical protein
MIRRLEASTSLIAPCRTFAQSSSVFGIVSTTPAPLMTVVTDSQTSSAAGSTIPCMRSLIVAVGVYSGISRADTSD